MGSPDGSARPGRPREVVAQPMAIDSIPAEAARIRRRRIRMIGLPSGLVGDLRLAALGIHPS
jgi:hypothetical protein